MRVIARPRETLTPIQSPFIIAEELIAPALMRSTCLLRTWTAGSAATTKYPMIIPTGIRSHPPHSCASPCPTNLPTGINPTLDPERKIVSPMNV